MKNAEIKENIFLPQILKCGFKLRFVKNDSYKRYENDENGKWKEVLPQHTNDPSYKVAFVSYYDEKGKFRHETSFNNWISQDVPTEEHKNVPTKGFKIFKQANRYSWNHFCSYRNVSVEIQDPRGWVFEISHDNLAWIIDNCNILKGDIEGEFVYGWDGKDRVLIPCASDTYKDLVKRSEKIINKGYINPSELKPYHVYKTKRGDLFTYIGRFDYYNHHLSYNVTRRKLKEMVIKEGYHKINDEMDLWAKCNKDGKMYLLKCVKKEGDKYVTDSPYNSNDVAFRNPKDKFVEEVDVIDDEEFKTYLYNTYYLFNRKFHYVDYSKDVKKRYITKEDMEAFRDYCISSTFHEGFMENDYENGSEEYVDKLSDITYFCEKGDASRWYSWCCRVDSEKKWKGFTYKKVSPNDEDYNKFRIYHAWEHDNYDYIHNFMTEEEFIENYKPYTFYIESDDGINEYITAEYEYEYYNKSMKRLDLSRT